MNIVDQLTEERNAQLVRANQLKKKNFELKRLIKRQQALVDIMLHMLYENAGDLEEIDIKVAEIKESIDKVMEDKVLGKETIKR